MIVESPE
jgi:DNA replication licensing factor MCM6